MREASPNRRGAVLFEVVLSLALFAGAAAFALSATRSVFRALEISHQEQTAIDLACSTLARLDAGIVTLAELRDPASGHEPVDDLDQPVVERWSIDAATERSDFRGLTLVVITVSETDPGDRAPIEVTLRQLVALRDTPPEDYRSDPLLDGLERPAAADDRTGASP